MSLILKCITLLALMIGISQNYTLTVSVDNAMINAFAGYTYVFSFSDNTMRSITLNFPDTSDLSSSSLSLFVNNNAAALSTGLYTVDQSLKRIQINNLTPLSNTLTIRVTNVKNPPSAIQFSFITSVAPPDPLTIPTPFVNYNPGTLLSCIWTYDKFTGSTNSIVDISIMLGNRLQAGNNQIQVQFPNLYEDSDSQYLTLNSVPVISYSIDNGVSYQNPLTSPSPFMSNTRINFWINLAMELSASSTLRIRFTGIVNPPTTNPSGRFFIVSTYDLNVRMIDRISQCNISPVNVLEIVGTFDQTSLSVGSLYTTPRVIVNSLIPFTVFQNDIMEMVHVDSLQITNSTPLEIQLTRGSPFVAFYLDISQPSTSTSAYFKGNIDNYNSGNAYSQVQLKFSINAPFSQKPWDFAFLLKRPSGAYIRIKASLQASAISIDSSKVTITPLSTEMSIQSQYTLSLQLQRPISRNGKILLGFNPDFSINAGPCVGYIGLSQITSTSSCELQIKNGQSWLAFKISDSISSIIPTGTIIRIQYASSSIRNPLYPNTYTFRLQVYYTDQDDSLVQQAAILGSVQMTKHFSFKGSLVTNDFTVYSLTTVTISYINEVYIPTNTALQFILPTAVYSFDFTGSISINGVTVANATFDKNFTGGKTGQITIRQDITPGTVWLIPIVVRMPYIAGDYPSITFKLMNSTIVYEQVDSGLIMRVKVPSTEMTALIEPKTSMQIDTVTDYLVKIQSRVPLPATFYLVLTAPVEIMIGSTLSCVPSNGTCSSIIKLSPTMLNLTQQNNPFTLTQNIQQFTYTINSFTNPRFQGSTSPWTVQIKGLYNGAVADISETTAVSSSYIHSTGVSCLFDSSKNYYRGNQQTVVISCNFTNNLVQGDFIEFTFTSNSYMVNPNALFSCSSPSLSLVQCQNSYNSQTTFKLRVNILSSFVSNRNRLNVEIAGLISSIDTTYLTPQSPILVSRYDSIVRLIDTGIFYYDINCNQNSTIISRSCRTCANTICTSCHLSMYLSANGTCIRDCQLQTQFRSLNNANTSQCQPCMSPCYTCQNTSTTCLSCTGTNFLYLSTHTCLPYCDTSTLYWINTVTYPGQKICDSCLAQCRVCTNNSFNGCLQCQPTYVLENGICRSGCLNPTSYLFNGICIPCDPACQTCTGGGANNCVQCKSLYYMNNGYCVAQCPFNKYPMANGICDCLGNCSTCTSYSPTYCNSCTDISQFLHNGNCLTSCPLYTYILVNQCIDCPRNCIQCVSSTTCSRCAPTFYSYESNCYFDCNTISFQYDVRGNSCVLCPTGCDTCSDNVCFTCLQGYTRNETECVKNCILTDTCAVESPVPSVVTPLPATIVFAVWVCVVLVAKFFIPKLYPPYAIVFFLALIELCLVLGTAIYTGGLNSQVVKRLLVTDISQRPVILNLLIAALALNYIMNIIFAIIFWRYISPLIKDPRQVDYITIGLVFFIGMLTNYRFILICFSKMFPKPYIHVQFASRLTPIHYMCIVSVFLSGITLGAAGLILKNQYPLTDLFMLGVDILIIEVILILLSIWFVAVNKDEKYFESDIKKYHLEENQRTEGNVFDDKDQKNFSKHQLRDQITFTQGNLPEENLNETTNYKHLLSKTSLVNPANEPSDFQQPLQKFSQTTKLNMQRRPSNSNKIQNSFDTSIGRMNKTKKGNKTQQNQNQQLKSKIKEIDSERKRGDNIFDSSGKKFETEDENQLPKRIEKKDSEIIVGVQEPESDEIPNLPITSSVFHERASSEFGQRIKPSKINNKLNQRSQTTLKNKSPKKSPSKSPHKSSKNIADIPNMKKKNKFFDSQIEAEPKKDINDADLENIIKSKIVVIEHNDKDENKFANTTLGDPHNISSIEKKDEEHSDFNEEVSPSWFNIQNQRFDLSEMGSEFSDN